MSHLETTDADYRITGLSLNGHPMRHLRPLLAPNGVRTAKDLFANGQDGTKVAHAGLVICRQRPGTAKGFVFLTLEDETGISNVIVRPDLYDRERTAVVRYPFLLVDGVLQHQDGVISVKAEHVEGLDGGAAVDAHVFY